MKTLIRIGTRPADIPQDWPIHNAPRPLYGTKTWEGDFIHGRFYAAIDPIEEFGEGWAKRNEDLDAYELVFISWEQAVNEAYQWYCDNLPKVAPKINLDDKEHQRMIITGWLKQVNQ